ncbi:MAG: urease accessory UreF family protein, partial [Ilumatobacteraceae bacterium]
MALTAAVDLSVLSTLLLLSDGRFPAGGHAHSGGFEAAASLESITDVPGVESYVLGRLYTVGLVAASFAAAACVAVRNRPDPDDGIGPAALEHLAELDDEIDARTPSPALRGASRQLGRQVVRAGRSIWPNKGLDHLVTAPGRGLHHPVALGAVAAAGGLGPQAVALAVAHDSVIGPAT